MSKFYIYDQFKLKGINSHFLAKTANKNSLFSEIGARDVPICIPAEGYLLNLNQFFLIENQTTIKSD